MPLRAVYIHGMDLPLVGRNRIRMQSITNLEWCGNLENVAFENTRYVAYAERGKVYDTPLTADR